MAETTHQEIRKTPETVWQRLKTDYESLVTCYDWVFDYDRDKSSIIRKWQYTTYIVLSSGGRKDLGRNNDRLEALKFHEEMVVKHGFF